MLDNIESNIHSIAHDTTSAAEELATASNYQRKAGKRAACLMIVIVIVICIVLLAVSLTFIPVSVDRTEPCLLDLIVRLSRVWPLPSLTPTLL